MSPSSPIPASLSELIFCGGEPDSYETQTCERELREGPSDSGDTAEKKPNVYVELFEGVLYSQDCIFKHVEVCTLRDGQDFG